MRRNSKIAGGVLCTFLLMIAVLCGYAYAEKSFKYPDTPPDKLNLKIQMIPSEKNDTVVIFHKSGCKDCNYASHQIKSEMSKNKQNKYIVIDVVKASNNKYVTQFNIKTVPTILHFKNGEEIDRYSGTDARNITKVIKE
ncbi:thioredoxin family protein [Weissella minor]|uniref:thioredoxin family protein n=1 Tax=Weissella minor TaxID=1620 RepID=UPI003AF22925